MNLEAEMATGIEPGPASESKRETRGVEIGASGNMGGTNTTLHERFSPRWPVFNVGLMAAVSMKAVKDYVLTGRLGRNVFRVDI